MLHMHCIIQYIMYIVGMGLSIHRVVVYVGAVLYRTWMLLWKLSRYITCIGVVVVSNESL